jgi:sporulation protein YlmC with PRC-barrel domain
MDLVRDVLDAQIVDRKGKRTGKVDGLVVLLRKDRPPKVVFIETGAVTLARRVSQRLAAWMMRRSKSSSVLWRAPCRVPWSRVRKVGVEIRLDVGSKETAASVLNDWLKRHIVGHIPGA